MEDFLMNPFTVVVDSREQLPYRFTGLKTDAKHGRKPLMVKTTTKAIASGDYSIEGLEHEIAIERKSLADLYSTLGQGRERFEREFERLNQMNIAFLMIESSWHEILTQPPRESQLNPRTIARTHDSWMMKYPRVHWVTMGDRVFSEGKTFRLLQRYWIQREEKAKQEAKAVKAAGRASSP